MTKKADILDLKDIPKLGTIGIEKLENEGIFTKKEMLAWTWLEISEITGMSKGDAEAAVQYCNDKLQEAGLMPKTEMTALEVLEHREKLKRWTTGSKAVDDLIGMIEAEAVTEFSGKFGSGKTQFGFTLCTTICMEKPEGKQPNQVIYIDSEKTFRPDRVKEIILSKDPKADWKEILSRITVQNAMSSAHTISILKNSAHLIEMLNIRAIILDSATARFRQQQADFGQQGLKFRMINKFVHLMGNIADIYSIPIIAINQVYDSPDPFNPGQKIYGGNVWGHAMTYRIGLRKKGKIFVATTIDFPHKPVEDALYDITKAGITDIKEKKKK